MIVREVMTTDLVTVEPDDTLSHAVYVLRQHQFHHLPVVIRGYTEHKRYSTKTRPALIYKGLLTSAEIEKAIALTRQEEQQHPLARPWQEQKIIEILSPTLLTMAPTTSLTTAAQSLVERGLNCAPVLEPGQGEYETQDLLVGLLTRSDLLLALARLLGAFEPGTQVDIPLTEQHMATLAKALLIADELHIGVQNILITSTSVQTTRCASLRLCTINPGPFLCRLAQEDIHPFDAITRGGA
ncbi:HPP family protein [Ktedonospora formicarum]|uniref:CBS domain-containing protein n=1 Tax=Ktedonospora formicarum TaxID=2778364 RepID=A0A8J3I792_9CHLR|nr:CBS domain-containing protein [Ktedonospora formicarum]GHO48736.1 hypothetical protein KSX_68990 [Ktedonospora formicarum]